MRSLVKASRKVVMKSVGRPPTWLEPEPMQRTLLSVFTTSSMRGLSFSAIYCAVLLGLASKTANIKSVTSAFQHIKSQKNIVRLSQQSLMAAYWSKIARALDGLLAESYPPSTGMHSSCRNSACVLHKTFSVYVVMICEIMIPEKRNEDTVILQDRTTCAWVGVHFGRKIKRTDFLWHTCLTARNIDGEIEQVWTKSNLNPI